MISEHQVLVYRALTSKWQTAKEIAALAGVSGRATRKHLLAWREEGFVEMENVFPSPLYRIRGSVKLSATEQRLIDASNAIDEANGPVDGE